jgi:hypothetical protein
MTPSRNKQGITRAVDDLVNEAGNPGAMERREKRPRIVSSIGAAVCDEDVVAPEGVNPGLEGKPQRFQRFDQHADRTLLDRARPYSARCESGNEDCIEANEGQCGLHQKHLRPFSAELLSDAEGVEVLVARNPY